MKKSTVISCCKEIHFSAGHRVMGHENKCAHLHGHNYKVELHAECEELDDVGRVIDFSVLKEVIGKWIDGAWDHGFILHRDDAAGIDAMEMFTSRMIKGRPLFYQKTFLMPYNPTAENMAKFLLEEVGPKNLQGTGVRLVNVVVHETYSCSASASILE